MLRSSRSTASDCCRLRGTLGTGGLCGVLFRILDQLGADTVATIPEVITNPNQPTPPIYYVRDCKYTLFARNTRDARGFAEISKLASANRVQRCAKFGTGGTRGGALGILANRSIKLTFSQGFLGNFVIRPTLLLVLHYITFLYEKSNIIYNI